MSFPIISPPQNSDALDQFWAQGWYRSGQKLFTLDYTYINDWVRVFWLRYRLAGFQLRDTHRKILRKAAGLSVVVKPFQLQTQYEVLFGKYVESVDFETSHSLDSLLYGNFSPGERPEDAFRSMALEVWQKDKLVGLGVMDAGLQAASGIVNLFDPELSKYSLGKLLILKKIEYAIQQKYIWFYPGYIGQNFPKLDYKLFVGNGCIELYDTVADMWLPYENGLVDLLAEQQQWVFQADEDNS